MALTRRDEQFLDRLGTKLGKAAVAHVRPRLSAISQTLSRALEVQRPTVRTTWVHLPHYWAVMVHEGRSPFSKPYAMVWFRDPRDDPRLAGGKYPVRATQLKRLSRAEFLYWVEQNRLADPTGLNPGARPMIVTRRIRKATAPQRFFDNDDGMRGFSRKAGEIAAAEFSRYVASVVPGAGVELVDTAVARL